MQNNSQVPLLCAHLPPWFGNTVILEHQEVITTFPHCLPFYSAPGQSAKTTPLKAISDGSDICHLEAQTSQMHFIISWVSALTLPFWLQDVNVSISDLDVKS